MRVGLVNNTFTQAAYNNAFYVFYVRYLNSPGYTTTDLNLLTGTIPNVSYPGTDRVASELRSILPAGSTVKVITDGDLHNGAASMFDVLVLFHQEYVTQKEYDNIMNFVQSGGTLVTMDGNLFFAEVMWDGASKVTLVKGHFWVNDIMNHRAYKTVNDGERWKSQTASWFGSNSDAGPSMTNFSYLQIGFRNNPFGYPVGRSGAENQYMTNSSDMVIMDYGVYGEVLGPIATYWKTEGSGKIICFGIFTSKIQSSARFWMFFDMVWMQYVLGLPMMMPKPIPMMMPPPTVPAPRPKPRPPGGRRMPGPIPRPRHPPPMMPPMPVMMDMMPVMMDMPMQAPIIDTGPQSPPAKQQLEQAANPTMPKAMGLMLSTDSTLLVLGALGVVVLVAILGKPKS